MHLYKFIYAHSQTEGRRLVKWGALSPEQQDSEFEPTEQLAFKDLPVST